jgi:hypothetical protein
MTQGKKGRFLPSTKGIGPIRAIERLKALLSAHQGASDGPVAYIPGETTAGAETEPQPLTVYRRVWIST